jgi:TPR repeat protein
MAVLIALATFPAPVKANSGDAALGVAIGALVGGALVGIFSNSSSPSPAPAQNVQWAPPPPIRRVPTLQERAERGNMDAQLKLAANYAEGRGVAKNEQEALKWYMRAAERGNATAQFSVGDMHAKGQGVVTNENTAIEWYSKSANQGNIQALDALRLLAQPNKPYAQVSLGLAYLLAPGLEENYASAVKLFRQAAMVGHAPGQFLLGVTYENGTGIVRDYAEAARWYEYAAQQGHAMAQYNLGLMLESGKGTSVDRRAAYKWFSLAAAQKNTGAEKSLQNLEGFLSSQELSDSQGMARRFTPRSAYTAEDMENEERLHETKEWVQKYYPYALVVLAVLIVIFGSFAVARKARDRKLKSVADTVVTGIKPPFATLKSILENSEQMGEKICISCKKLIRAKAEMCPNCGTLQQMDDDAMFKRTA